MGIIFIEYKVATRQLINKNTIIQLGLPQKQNESLQIELSAFESSFWLRVFSISPGAHVLACTTAAILLCFTVIVPVVCLMCVVIVCVCRVAYYGLVSGRVMARAAMTEAKLKLVCPDVHAQFVMKDDIEVNRFCGSPSATIYFRLQTVDCRDLNRDETSVKATPSDYDYDIGAKSENIDIYCSPKLESVNTRANNKYFKDYHVESPDMHRRHRVVSQIRGVLEHQSSEKDSQRDELSSKMISIDQQPGKPYSIQSSKHIVPDFPKLAIIPVVILAETSIENQFIDADDWQYSDRLQLPSTSRKDHQLANSRLSYTPKFCSP